MASKELPTRSRKRVTPYDINMPVNWTVAKLKNEISALGINLTSKTIPKSALLQIYEQLSSVRKGEVSESENNSGISNTNDESEQIIMDNPGKDTNQDTVVSSVPTVTIDNVTNANQPVQDLQTHGLLQGFMTAMQGTIATLQSTVTNLQQKQTGTTAVNTNPLETFYSGTQQQPTSIQNTATQHGIPADNLPHIDVVSDNMRRNITAVKYVNLATLLIPDMDIPKAPENMSALEFLKRQQKDHRLDRSLTITEFFKAFGIYKRVMCEAFPQCRDELDLYEADIGNIYDHYGEVFYQYHVSFTKKAAAYMEKGIKVDWSKRHKDLFQLLIGGSKTRLCEHCSQADHQSPFCPTQINVVPSSKQRPNSGLNVTKDKNGRPRITFKGKEICNNFNGQKGCNRIACPFEHICLKCKRSGHSQLTCHPNTVSGPEQSNSAGPKNKPKPSE